MIKENLCAKRLLSLTVSLVLILSLTLFCAPAVFADEYYFVGDETEFRSAYAEAAAGETIALTSDITLTQDLLLDKDVEIACGFYTITIGATVSCSAGSISAITCPFHIENGGELRVLPGATIYGGESCAIAVSNGGSLIMSGGSITSEHTGIDLTGGTASITGGTIAVQANDGVGVAVEGGSLSMRGGSITSKYTGIALNGGTANITGGTIAVLNNYGIGVAVDNGSLQMSGGTIQLTGFTHCIGVALYSGAAVFTGGNIYSDNGVCVLRGEVTASVPAQQLSGIFYSAHGTPMVTSSPAAITMQRGQTRTVTLDEADNLFALYEMNTSPELNAQDAGQRSATIRPLQAGSYTLCFQAMIGEGEAFVYLNIPVTVTNPSSGSSSSDSSSSDTEAELPQPKPTIPETGAGNLFLLLLFVLCL